MSASTPLPHDHPLMTAWRGYKATPDYENTKQWAVHAANTEGSLWAAFVAGYEAGRDSVPKSEVDAFLDGDEVRDTDGGVAAEASGLMREQQMGLFDESTATDRPVPREYQGIV